MVKPSSKIAKKPKRKDGGVIVFTRWGERSIMTWKQFAEEVKTGSPRFREGWATPGTLYPAKNAEEYDLSRYFRLQYPATFVYVPEVRMGDSLSPFDTSDPPTPEERKCIIKTWNDIIGWELPSCVSEEIKKGKRRKDCSVSKRGLTIAFLCKWISDEVHDFLSHATKKTKQDRITRVALHMIANQLADLFRSRKSWNKSILFDLRYWLDMAENAPALGTGIRTRTGLESGRKSKLNPRRYKMDQLPRVQAFIERIQKRCPQVSFPNNFLIRECLKEFSISERTLRYWISRGDLILPQKVQR